VRRRRQAAPKISMTTDMVSISVPKRIMFMMISRMMMIVIIAVMMIVIIVIVAIMIAT